MGSWVLLSILFAPTAATLTRVSQWHTQGYSTASCSAASKVADGYKELGLCNKKDATTWEKAVGSATAYTSTKYTDSACTTTKSAEIPEVLNATCSGSNGDYKTGTVVATFDTYRGYGPYTDNACTTLATNVFGPSYHAMNTCQQTSATTSVKFMCTATTIQNGAYGTKDCSGARNTTGETVWTSGDVCTAYPAGNKNAGKFYKYNCGPVVGGGVASMAARVQAQVLAQLFLCAAIAGVVSI